MKWCIGRRPLYRPAIGLSNSKCGEEAETVSNRIMMYLHFDRGSRFFPIGPSEYKAVAGLVTNHQAWHENAGRP